MESKKRGMTFECRIATPMYERNQKRYLEFELTEPTVRRVRAIHERAIDWCVDPLQGDILKVKVPYRYNRVTCKVGGIRTIQEMREGDTVSVHIEFCGVWKVGDYRGLSWKLVSIE